MTPEDELRTRVRVHLETTGATISGLARQAGITKNRLWRWLANGSGPTRSYGRAYLLFGEALALCKIIGSPLGDLSAEPREVSWQDVEAILRAYGAKPVTVAVARAAEFGGLTPPAGRG